MLVWQVTAWGRRYGTVLLLLHVRRHLGLVELVESHCSLEIKYSSQGYSLFTESQLFPINIQSDVTDHRTYMGDQERSVKPYYSWRGLGT